MKSVFKELFGADMGDFLKRPVPEPPRVARHRITSQDGVITITGKFKKLVINGREVRLPEETKQ